MRTIAISGPLFAVLAGLLSGCSGGSSQPAVQPIPAARSAAITEAKAEKDLFVSNNSNEVVILTDGTYMDVGDITDGIDGAAGIWVDPKGNLYVANYEAANVTEYKKGGSAPVCTYSASLHDPVDVTTDDAGNVYVDDFNLLQNPGYIDKFAQCSNTISAQYDIDKGPEGVAVDSAGDIFVSYFGGNFEEFKSGSSTPTPLGATVGEAAGLIVDKNENLIADDEKGNIDVIAPPYSSATVLVSGLDEPDRASLNKRENLLFNANYGSGTVTVYKYPSGKLLKTLGSSNGISAAAGVAESPSATF
jgi:hypothetical protein